jgi:hypothetical protein
MKTLVIDQSEWENKMIANVYETSVHISVMNAFPDCAEIFLSYDEAKSLAKFLNDSICDKPNKY